MNPVTNERIYCSLLKIQKIKKKTPGMAHFEEEKHQQHAKVINANDVVALVLSLFPAVCGLRPTN